MKWAPARLNRAVRHSRVPLKVTVVELRVYAPLNGALVSLPSKSTAKLPPAESKYSTSSCACIDGAHLNESSILK